MLVPMIHGQALLPDLKITGELGAFCCCCVNACLQRCVVEGAVCTTAWWQQAHCCWLPACSGMVIGPANKRAG